MALSPDLLSQFAKLVNKKDKTDSESVVYGTIVKNDKGELCVRLDGSNEKTPIGCFSSTADTKDIEEDERIAVTIKNHTATIMGNTSSPSARIGTVNAIGTEVGRISGAFDELSATVGTFDQIYVGKGTFDELDAKVGKFGELYADKAKFEELEANVGKFGELYADKAEFKELQADVGTFDELIAKKADIEHLQANYANIDFANIGEAAFLKIFAESGIIENAVFSDGTFTGRIVGVTIKGDVIEGGTIVAEKLVVLGEDGLYYKLNTNGVTVTAEQTEYNSLNGSIITAKSVTAEKVSVDDLVAFGATIGGFHITNRSLYSGVKESVGNTTKGIYMDADGQFVLGDDQNFIKFYSVGGEYEPIYEYDEDAEEEFPVKLTVVYDSEGVVTSINNVTVIEAIHMPEAICTLANTRGVYKATLADNSVIYYTMVDYQFSNGTWIDYYKVEQVPVKYKLGISASSILFGEDDDKFSAEDLTTLVGHVHIRNHTVDGEVLPCVELGKTDDAGNSFRQVITNKKTMFMEGDTPNTVIDTDGVSTDNLSVDRELRHNNLDQNGSYVWAFRANGNYGLSWKGGAS